MKHKIDIEELLAAARRVEADNTRQEKLSRMVDQWAATPQNTITVVTTHRRRSLWTVMGIAASLLLLATTAVILSRQTSSPSSGTLIAAAPHISMADTGSTVSDGAAAAHETTVPVVGNPRLSQRNNVTTPSPRTIVNEFLAEREEESLMPQVEKQEEEEPLNEDEVTPIDERAPEVLLADNKPRVYERRSTRLLQTSKKEGRKQSTSIQQPALGSLIAFAGTGTDFEIGKINF